MVNIAGFGLPTYNSFGSGFGGSQSSSGSSNALSALNFLPMLSNFSAPSSGLGGDSKGDLFAVSGSNHPLGVSMGDFIESSKIPSTFNMLTPAGSTINTLLKQSSAATAPVTNTTRSKTDQLKDLFTILLAKLKVEKNPEDVQARNQLANLYAKNGKTDLAITEAKKTLELDANNVGALTLLSTCYLKKGENTLAIDTLKKLVEVEPDNFNAHMDLGKAYRDTNQKELAVLEAKEALRIKPADTSARSFLKSLIPTSDSTSTNSTNSTDGTANATTSNKMKLLLLLLQFMKGDGLSGLLQSLVSKSTTPSSGSSQ